MEGDIYKHNTVMLVYDSILYIRPAFMVYNSTGEQLADGIIFQLPESALEKYNELKDLIMIKLLPALEKINKRFLNRKAK